MEQLEITEPWSSVEGLEFNLFEVDEWVRSGGAGGQNACLKAKTAKTAKTKRGRS